MSEQTNTTPWPQRFGTLADVTERQGAKGTFATFKVDAKDFSFYGACFDADIIAQMKDAIGKRVWMKGPVETRTVNGEEKRSFKAVYFRLSEDAQAGQDATAEAEAA